MSARIVCDRLVIQDQHFPLHPLTIIDALTTAAWCSEATFVTSITVRYTPNVSSDTPGQVVIAAARAVSTTHAAAFASSCKAIAPVWKSLHLVIPKEILNFQRWTREQSPHLWLSCLGVAGTVDISCTIRCATHLQLPQTVLPSLTDRVSRLETNCYLGPILAGFSYIGLMVNPGQSVAPFHWPGNGQVININLKNGDGVTTGHRYIRTPENRNYVAVRYGFGSSFNYAYSSANNSYSWSSWRDTLATYTTKDSLSYAVPVSYYGSWRPVKGSTSWWAEINPKYTRVAEGSPMTTHDYYHPCTQLILYYEYPGVDIFAPDFKPSIKVTPGTDLPCFSGAAVPNRTQNLPLNVSLLQAVWSPHWNPDLQQPNQLSLFDSAREKLLAWPVNCGAQPKRRPSDESECEEDLCARHELLPEPGEASVDHSA